VRRPLYAACNEDTRSEIAALAPTEADLVVCVAAGGGRALSLLGAGGGRMLAIDRSEAQLHGLELFAAALDAFPYALLRGFVGLDPMRGRCDAYEALRPSLSPRAQRHWDARRDSVEAGVLYAGRLETILARASATLRRVGVLRWPDAAFAARSLAEQRAILLREADDVVRGARAWTALLHPLAVALVLRDPSFRRSTEGRVGLYLYGRLLDWSARHLLRESFLLHLLYYGRYDAAGALPLWLEREGAEQARKNLARLTLRHATLADAAASVPRDAPIAWSLSDVSAWMDERAFHALLAKLVAASPPGSRLCWRHLAAQWRAPALPGLALDTGLGQRLEREDRSVFYTIHAAEVVEP
jgi:S-adenosylmethionine:diacylglycerol 3-amino-3-carboxypropyl transferase